MMPFTAFFPLGHKNYLSDLFPKFSVNCTVPLVIQFIPSNRFSIIQSLHKAGPHKS